ncbi:uncharacterized protein LOC141646352 [Silene latifolia]|uniref:uncharacterized protein LOC141646352 n=1 Tax=Silene latifolia TaxID=37657 RepID=UPI003D774D59
MSNRGSTDIVVHAVCSEDLPEGKEGCLYGELYRVNLDTGKISKCRGRKLYFDDELTSMAISGDIIYILGGAKEDYPEYVKDKHPKHSRVSYIDLASDDPEWMQLPECITPLLTVPGVTFKGNLFVFGGNFEEILSDDSWQFYGEKLCLPLQRHDSWRIVPCRPLPPPEANVIHCPKPNNVSTPVVVDSKNDRILVHFLTINSLYAYYPDRIPRWDFLFFIGWSRVVGVFDDMILFHSRGYFHAFDLQNGSEINDIIISADFPSNLLYLKYDAIIPLSPPGTFCLAVYYPEFNLPDITHLVFAKFRVLRKTCGQIHIIFISHHNLALDCKACVINYVPIANLEDAHNPSKEDSCGEAEQPGLLGIYVGTHRI